MIINSGGGVSMEFRTYVNCTATLKTGCDRISGHTIFSGGHVAARITRVINATTVVVTVSSTSAPSLVSMGTFRLGHDLGRDALAPLAGGFRGIPFCGPGAPSGYCGA
jgi:hypothetical protein